MAKRIMKHNLKVTLLLLSLFMASHIVGLYVTQHYLPIAEEIEIAPGIIFEKPQMDEQTSFLPIFIAILVATGLALILIKFNAMRLWKLWFFISVVFTLSISFGAFIPSIFAFTLAIILAVFKVIRPNVYIHNITEIFIYGALAAIFVPILNLFSVSILLVLISIYDMIAVWRTKHMVSMAKFQTKSKMFTGLLIPYNIPKEKSIQKTIPKGAKTKITNIPIREAILGGGDIAFPLLFSGVILKLYGFLPALLISFFAALALFFLFAIAEKKKFYPAMPFVAVGCFIGYLVLKLFFI